MTLRQFNQLNQKSLTYVSNIFFVKVI